MSPAESNSTAGWHDGLMYGCISDLLVDRTDKGLTCHMTVWLSVGKNNEVYWRLELTGG